jgi:ferrochelatase
MTASKKTGLLLVNLGTPESPRPVDVRPYLREFLMDPRVIDIPIWKRWPLVNLIIAPLRARASGVAYSKVWTDRGSPLLFHGQDLAEKIRLRLGPEIPVELAMRYGNPSIPAALHRLSEASVDRIVVFPLYPQYSSAATGSSLEKVFASASALWNVPSLQVVPPFFDHPGFIDACAEVARPHVERPGVERIFFSFHGLPERHVRKSDDGGGHCLERDDCCDNIVAANRNCYRAQCYATARAMATRLGLPAESWIVCFQSRLGRDPWIRPYTDKLLAAEARAGRRKAVILSPAFVADCLETIEELGLRGAETWRENGGESLDLVPCLNADDAWADAAVSIARECSSWLDPVDVARSP